MPPLARDLGLPMIKSAASGAPKYVATGAREISNLLLIETYEICDTRGLNQLAVNFGQFLDHTEGSLFNRESQGFTKTEESSL